jgi:hypothetical protein
LIIISTLSSPFHHPHHPNALPYYPRRIIDLLQLEARTEGGNEGISFENLGNEGISSSHHHHTSVIIIIIHINPSIALSSPSHHPYYPIASP